LFAGALVVFFIGSPSLEDKYNKVKFTRTESIPQLNADPIVNTYTYTANEMLEKRLVHITPAEAFKAKYTQIMNPIYLDVRPEAEYNLYHIEDAVNVPLDRIDEIVPLLLSEPPANSVFIVMGNGEATATDAWKLLVGSGVTNSYILEGGLNNWIAFFGTEEQALQPDPKAGDDELGYIFPAALGSQYESCSPNPIEYAELEFEAKIVLQLKRDKSGGGCG
jgi:hypothetical protein